MGLSDQPPWLSAAWRELGQKEKAGSAANRAIAKYFKDIRHEAVTDDETAWCAAFTGAMLERSGIRSTRSLRARSYLTWGQSLDQPRTGAVAVLSRGNNAALGHVGFIVGTIDTKVMLLGGNQADAVSIAAFDRSRVLSYRWPHSGVVPEQSQPDPVKLSAGFAVSLAHVLAMEGGFTDDRYDPGGPQIKGSP